MPVFLWLWGVLALAAAPSATTAQWPGEIRGRITDVVSGRAIPAADIQVLPEGVHVASGADGSFHFRALNPGPHVVRVTAYGYSTTTVDTEVRNGLVRELPIGLGPVALPIEGIGASVAGFRARAITLGANDIRSNAGVTAGDVLRTVPGVLIVTTSAGGPQTPSMRGSGADAVLVLVDGVPLNDPITGEADLSTLPASGVASITVLPGGLSAVYGARAAAGVILIQTGSSRRIATAGGGIGSLGERNAEAAKAWTFLGGRLDVVGSYRRREGAFRFDLPPEVGGGEGRITNADSRLWSGRLGWTREDAGSITTAGLSTEQVDRGLPGRSFAPSPSARQRSTQARVFWSTDHHVTPTTSARASGYLRHHRSNFHDAAPPFGDPFDNRTTLIGGGGEGSILRAMERGLLALGGAARHHGVSSTVLSGPGSLMRTDLAGWVSGAYSGGPLGTAWTATVRVDRGGLPAEWFGSHDLGLQTSIGAWVTLHGGHRSSFSPPTLGDQFFRGGVGIEPNPYLQAERVRSEWTGGAALEGGMGMVRLSVDVEAYVGDVEGMILWLPDFRFVWSPRNRDVSRGGLDVRGGVRLPESGIETWAAWSYSRTTYVRPNSDDVQVAYRPRFQGGLGASLTRSTWSVVLDGRYIGARFPVPNNVNELQGFWTADLAVRRSWRIGGAILDAQLEIQRLRNEQDTLILAFPHPGRTFRVTLRASPIARS